MPVPLTTALLVAGAALTAVSDAAACVVMGLGLLNQVIVEVVTFPSGNDNGLG